MTETRQLLECVVNVSEGRDLDVVGELAAAGAPHVLDVHSDAEHNRSVLTMAGEPGPLQSAVRAVTTRAVERLDIRRHEGAHPRLGVVDVVPFVPLPSADGSSAPDEGMDGARGERGAFSEWAGRELELPCFLYGPERSLPDVRRRAFRELAPDTGPAQPHPSAGACAVGVRPVMLAWNLWLERRDVPGARRLAAELRGEHVRTLVFALESGLQLSFNLLAPLERGPAEIYEDVLDAGVAVSHAELVGLAPAALLEVTPPELWERLDLDPSRTIEAHLRGSTSGESGAGGSDADGIPDQPTPN